MFDCQCSLLCIKDEVALVIFGELDELCAIDMLVEEARVLSEW